MTAMTRREPQQVFVYVPSETGRKIHTVEITPEMLVRELKRVLSEPTGVRVRDQLLTYGAKILEDNKALAMYGPLGPQATVHLCVKQKGGCFIISLSILTALAAATLAAPCTCGTSLLLYLFLVPPLFVLPFFCL